MEGLAGRPRKKAEPDRLPVLFRMAPAWVPQRKNGPVRIDSRAGAAQMARLPLGVQCCGQAGEDRAARQNRSSGASIPPKRAA